jgi:phage major head subunit gpT-like protein
MSDKKQLTHVTMTATPTIEAAGGEAGDLPRFSMVAYTGGTMRIAGFPHAVVVDLAGLDIPSQRLPIRLDHERRQGVGHTQRIAVDQGQLVAEGLISRDTSWARDVAKSGVKGFPWQASIGAEVVEAEFVPAGGRVEVNGKEFTGPVHVVRKAVLKEISFVDSGADKGTSASVAAESNQEKTMKTKVKDDDKITPDPDAKEQAKVEAAGDKGAEALTPADPVAQMRAEAATETKRIAAIHKVCDGKNPDIEAKAIEEGWDATRCELEVLRVSRPKAPAIHARDDDGVTGQVLEAACLITGGIRADDLTASHGEQALEAATKRFRGGIGLQELLLEAAWANGYTGRNFRDSRAVLRFAFRPDLQASFSTIDIGGILSNVANKFLLEGFFSVERTWRNICAVRNVSDFKTVTSYRLIGTDQYEIVAPGGELKHGTLGEESYTNKADTYGLMLSIDRRDIINDDLGAITTVPRKLGRGSGLKINDVFWTIFLGNSGFFKTANKNYVTGADTALSIDGLTKAEVKFMDQVDSDGKPIGIMPAVLLAPTALSAIGTQLFKSLEIRDTTADTKYPIANPHQGKFRAEVSRYLSNSSYTGYSAKAWYLLADPSDLPVIEVAFLNGQESPTIETADADFNVLGVQMRGYHDFGVALQDPKGGIKAKGEA